MSDKFGTGEIINVMENYKVFDVIVDGKFFTALAKENLDEIEKLETFDMKLPNDRMLFDCKIDNKSVTDDGTVIRGYFVKFE